VQWYTPVIPGLGGLRQEDWEFEASLDYVARPYPSKKERGGGKKEEKEKGRKGGRKERKERKKKDQSVDQNTSPSKYFTKKCQITAKYMESCIFRITLTSEQRNGKLNKVLLENN
jgi:hypothetical protein